MNRMSVCGCLLIAVLAGCVESQDRAPSDDDAVLSSTEQAVFTTADCPVTPATLAPPADQNIKKILHAAGVQRYRCDALASGGYGWTFVEPDADLFLNCYQVGTHYIGPTWEYKDGTIITATKIASANAPEALTSIPWLLLQVNGHSGPTLGAFADVNYVQRLSTGGGIAPLPSACDATTVGTFANAPYTADYVFYKTAHVSRPELNVRCGG